MTEDDTFEALRRTPFSAMVTPVSEYNRMTPQKIISMWNSCYLDVVRWNGPSEEWIQIYKGHGWTFEQLVEEASKHANRR